MGSLVVRFRKKDAEIEKALEKLSELYDKSDIAREALRQFLFNKTKYNSIVNNSVELQVDEESFTLKKLEVSNEAIDHLLEDVLSGF
ncbi:hypothetical protein D3C86_1145450 [compost metagenome]